MQVGRGNTHPSRPIQPHTMSSLPEVNGIFLLGAFNLPLFYAADYSTNTTGSQARPGGEIFFLRLAVVGFAALILEAVWFQAWKLLIDCSLVLQPLALMRRVTMWLLEKSLSVLPCHPWAPADWPLYEDLVVGWSLALRVHCKKWPSSGKHVTSFISAVHERRELLSFLFAPGMAMRFYFYYMRKVINRNFSAVK